MIFAFCARFSYFILRLRGCRTKIKQTGNNNGANNKQQQKQWQRKFIYGWPAICLSVCDKPRATEINKRAKARGRARENCLVVAASAAANKLMQGGVATTEPDARKNTHMKTTTCHSTRRHLPHCLTSAWGKRSHCSCSAPLIWQGRYWLCCIFECECIRVSVCECVLKCCVCYV